ncbi:MAG: M48 family metallopeptidase [Pseudomonadota bacterium]|nr:MAG: M48 family metallopeptidase [Pseudomonadota bacterium]
MLFLKKRAPKPPPDSKPVLDWLPQNLAASLAEAGFDAEQALAVKHSTRARRLSLRTNVKARQIVLTFPAAATWRQAQEFVADQQRWILSQIRQISAAAVILQDGETFPFLGEPHLISATGKLRGAAERRDGILYMAGAPEHIPRRVRDYLTAQAREEISWRAREKAESIGRKISRIRIGDPHSRWGSCSSQGVLSFSWRLVMAPEEMLDYVVAHEVAHLRHMDHSRAFWTLCQSLTETNVSKSRKWFKVEGAKLFSYHGGAI